MTTLLVIGSHAARKAFPHFPRVPADVDYVTLSSASEDFVAGLRVSGGDVFSHPDLDAWLRGRPDGGYARSYASPDELYTFKVSHSHWEIPNGSWGKHMADVVWLRRQGAKLMPELYDVLVPVWAKVHGAKKMSLDREKGAFFTDAVTRTFDHDSIHMSVAFGDRPLYERFLKPGASVDMDMSRVRAAGFDTICMLLREEVYATALERIVIPRDYRCSPGAAYLWALRRTITSLTKGWTSRFMIENYHLFRDLDAGAYGCYVERHLSKKHLLIPLEEPKS